MEMLKAGLTLAYLLELAALLILAHAYSADRKSKENGHEDANDGDDGADHRPAQRFFLYALLPLGGMSFLWFVAAAFGVI